MAKRDPADSAAGGGVAAAGCGGLAGDPGGVGRDAGADAVAVGELLKREAAGAVAVGRPGSALPGPRATGAGVLVTAGLTLAVIVTSLTPSVRPIRARTCFFGGIAARAAAS